MRRLEKLLRPFFDKYDDDKSGQLDKGEFWSVFHDLQEHVQTQVRTFGEKATGVFSCTQQESWYFFQGLSVPVHS